MHNPRARTALLLGAVLSLVVAAPAVAHPNHGGGSQPRVVAQGLDNPRGLAFGPDGALYVAESGRGGADCVIPAPEGEGTNCFGTTGAITRIDVGHGGQERVVEALPSIASPEGGEASGPSDISFGKRGRGFFTVGLGGDPALREQFPQTAGMAKLYVLKHGGEVKPIADLGAFEAANNPDADQPGSAVDTNPNSVDASWHKLAVADAGGNDVLAVSKRKGISVLGVIPFTTAPAPPGIPDVPEGTPLPTQSVPTSIVRGPDGAYYVGQLTGFPFPVGGASVWRIEPGSAPEVYASGFTQITDLAFGRDGSLYVLEIATGSLAGPPTPGALIRVAPDGERSELAPGTLMGPTGLALGHRAAYVSNHGAEAGAGEVVRIPLGDH
jgi:hypothetical protein